MLPSLFWHSVLGWLLPQFILGMLTPFWRVSGSSKLLKENCCVESRTTKPELGVAHRLVSWYNGLPRSMFNSMSIFRISEMVCNVGQPLNVLMVKCFVWRGQCFLARFVAGLLQENFICNNGGVDTHLSVRSPLPGLCHSPPPPPFLLPLLGVAASSHLVAVRHHYCTIWIYPFCFPDFKMRCCREKKLKIPYKLSDRFVFVMVFC